MTTIQVNNLSEISLIAGTIKTLEYSVYRSSGVPFDLTGYAGVKLVLAPMGQPDNNILQVDGTITGTKTFYFILTNNDTKTVSG